MSNVQKEENYLEKTPVRNPDIVWSADENGAVTLEIENNGVFKLEISNNKLSAQKGNYDYDVEFDINTITQLVFSYIDASEAFLLNGIDENNKVKKFLNEVFPKKDNYINEYI